MPMIPTADDPGLRTVLGQAPVTKPPDFDALPGAAFRQANSVVSIIQGLRNSGAFTPEDGYSALPDIKGTPYFDNHSDKFVASFSKAETDSIKRQIDQEEADRKTLASAGSVGMVASMVAGTLDPTMLLPGKVAFTVAKEGRAFVQGAKEVGAAMAVQSTAQELALQGSQQTRPASESALNVASATMLGSLLGGGAASLLAREGRLPAAIASLDRDRAEMAAHAGDTTAWDNYVKGLAPEKETVSSPAVVVNGKTYTGQSHLESLEKAAVELNTTVENIHTKVDDNKAQQLDAWVTSSGRIIDSKEAAEIANSPHAKLDSSDPEFLKGSSVGVSAGAAAADTRQVELAPSGLNWLTAKLDPMSRLLNAESVSARRSAVDLAETPLLTKENIEGIPTTSGPALERSAKMAINQTRVAVSDQLDNLWKDLRFAGEDAPWFAKLRDQANMLERPAGMPTFDEFKQMVSKAMQEGDKSDIPQVQTAAQFVRARVFEPWKERAIQAGLLPEGVDVKTADSYFQRLYNKDAIAAKRPEFVNTVTDWLKGDQSVKQAAQGRINLYAGALDVYDDTIKKLTNELERKTVALEQDQALRDEVSKINKFANQRATTLREGGAAKNIDKARGGAVFETKVRDRGNTLADRASAHAAEVETLEIRLNAEHAKVAEMRKKIEDEIGKWEGKSTADAKSAIKAREKYEAERAAKAAEKGEAPSDKRLTSADDAIDRAVKRIIESDRDLSDAELRGRAHEITQRILGSPDGRLPYDVGSGGPETGYNARAPEPPRGPLAAREFNIPDAMIREFLEQDIEHVVAMHLRTMVPDVLLAERFGDVRMTEAFRKIEDDYAALIDQTKAQKDRTQLGKEREAALRDLAAIRDRIRGTYGMEARNAMKGAARVATAVKNYNVLTSMGMASVSSLPDMAGAVFRHGMGTAFNDAWSPFVSSLMSNRELSKEALRQFRGMGIAIESFAAERHRALNDIMDTFKPQSRLERTLQFGADKFQFVNMLGPWTDFAKTMASMAASQEIFRASEAMAKGTATARQMRSLAENGIERATAERIAEQYRAHGNVVDGTRLPNTDEWTHQGAREAFEGAVGREADIAVVTPGQEKPLWLSNPVVSVIGQFKSFTAASTQRILIANLQRHDAQVMQGLVASLGLGMISYKVNALLGGQPTSDKPQDWIKEAISRGGLLGWLEEGNALTSKMTRGGVDVYRLIGSNKPLSRYAGRSVLDQMLGPTAGKIEALASVTGAVGARDWKESDTKALRKLTAFQNVFFLRNLFNQVETGANNAFGIPMKAPPPAH